MTKVPKNSEEYLSTLPVVQREALEALRATIRSVDASLEERMSSGAPFFWYCGRRAVGFGAATTHLSFYIMHGDVLQKHRTELAKYDVSRTVIRFTPAHPLPDALIRKLVRARLAEIAGSVGTKVGKPSGRGGRGTLKTCPQGHRFHKSSDCPVCPVCESVNKPAAGFLARLGAPARRALENAGIVTLQELAKFAEADLLALHGVGPSTMPKLRAALADAGLAFSDTRRKQ